MNNKVNVLLIKKASKGLINELQEIYQQFAKEGVKHAVKTPIVPFRVYKSNGLFSIHERYFNMRIKFQLLPVQEVILQIIEEIDEDQFYQGIKDEKSDPTTETGYKTFKTNEGK